MSHKSQAIDVLHQYLARYLDERYQEDIARSQWQKLSKSQAFGAFQKSSMAKKFNDYVANVMLEIGIKVYADCRDSVHKKIKKEISFVVNNLFTNEEAKELHLFCQTDVGRKLLRNLDMFREAYGEAAMELMLKSYEAYSQPEVSGKIVDFIAQLEAEEEDTEQDETQDE